MTCCRIGGAALVCLIAGSVACKCGEQAYGEKKPEYSSTLSALAGAQVLELAGLVPRSVDVAVFADSPEEILAWLRTRDWWQGLTVSPLWADLRLSGPLYKLAQLRHRLQAASPVPLDKLGLEEVLATPLAVALRLKGEHPAVLLVKQIDVRVKALERLAESFNQAKAETVGSGVGAYKRIQGLAYVVYANLLLVSNDETLLREAALLAAHDSSDSLASDSDAKEVLVKASADAVAYFQPGQLQRLVHAALPFDRMALYFKLGGRPEAEIRATPTAAGAAAFPKALAREALGLLPETTRLVVARTGVDLGDLYKLTAAKGAAPPPALTGQALVALLGAASATPEAVLLLKLANEAKAWDGLVNFLRRSTGSQGETSKDPAGVNVWSADAGEGPSPALALAGGFAVLGSTRAAVLAVLAARAGRTPSIDDAPGLAERLLGSSDSLAGLVFVDSAALLDDSLKFARSVIGSSKRFDRNDVDDTLAPLFGALGKIGKLGGGLVLEDQKVRGVVVPL